MSMFAGHEGIPSTITGFRKLAAAVKAGEVKNKHAKAALRAIAAKRTKVEGTKLGKALADCESGAWKPKAKADKAEAPAKAPAKAKGKAKAKAESGAKATGERMFADLSGLERHRALRAEAERLGLATGGKSIELEARIREAAPAKAKTPAKAKGKAAKVAKAAKPTMPSPEALQSAVDALTAWLANQ
jgi:hypothetical protein